MPPPDARPGVATAVLARAITYAALFVGFVLVFLPANYALE